MEDNNKIKTSIISAIQAENRTIGKESGGLPWHIPEDFKHFKNITTGHPIIMGRTTWEEFKGKPLPNRTHIIITRQENYSVPENILVCNSIEQGIAKAKEIAQSKNLDEIFIIGGSQIYGSSINYADRLYLTLVQADINSNKKFPDYSEFGIVVSNRKSNDANYEYEFIILEK